ncbi:MAG TPA: hypothetical protein VFV54_06980 [Thermoanaerobaculia bacterium]|nr:hypothetical protein [Thermoanaerobaculia bacterium]
MRAITLVSLIVSFLAFASAARAEAPALAIRALEAVDDTREDGWSFTRTTTQKGVVRVERHDASKPEGARWTLVTLNGRTPTQREMREYAREKAERLERRKKNESDDEQEVDQSSIRLVSEDRERAVFAFRTRGEGTLGAAVTEHIGGTLVVVKDGGWPERFELSASEPIRPIPGVRVDAFRVVLTFQRDRATGDLLPLSIESRVRGRAFGLKSLDDDASVRYTDYARPGRP